MLLFISMRGVDIMKGLVFAILVVVVLSLAVAANAQTFRGAINGTVTDPSGAVVPNAQVKATAKATGIEYVRTTTANGLFAFQDLPIGPYEITVTAAGFATLTVDDILVDQGAIYTLPAKLSLGGAITQVQVSAAALTIDTTTVTQTTLLTGESVQVMPENGRDFSQMLQLTPGSSGYAAGGDSGQVNGTRYNQLNWQIDGVDDNDLWWNTTAINQSGVNGIAGIILPIDAIDQFSMQTQSAPEVGRNSGGSVDVALKSGGNDFHGTTYFYIRNEALAAASPFVTSKKENRNYNLGFSLGGPILKDRLFFFTTFEKQKFTIGLPGTGTEPTTAYQNAALQLMGVYNVTENPVSQLLLANLWPSSTLAGPAAPYNYSAASPEWGFSYNGLAKVDYRVNNKNNLSAHWFIGTGNQVAPVLGSAIVAPVSQIPYYFETGPIHVQNYAVVLNSVFTPRFMNQLLVGVNYYEQSFDDFNHSFDVSNYGLDLAPNFAQYDVMGAPKIVIGAVSASSGGGGFDKTGITPPEGRQDVTGQITDSVSYTVGKHQFRFGGEYRRAQLDEFYRISSLGELVFDGTQADGTNGKATWSTDLTSCSGPYFGAANPAVHAACLNGTFDLNITRLADFMAGYLNTGASTITLGNTARLVYVKTFSFFAQDAWQVSPKLSFNYGLRWDYEGPLGDGKNDLSVFIPSKGGLVTQGPGGISSVYPKQFKNFSPRVGFAYRPKTDGALVVRGNVGIYYDTPNLNPFLEGLSPNGASMGIEANPVGTIPVTTVTAVSPIITANQPVFMPGPACPSGNGCPVIYNLFSVNQKFHTAYNYNYSLNIEKGLGNTILLQVGYVGSVGHHLLTQADLNQPALSAVGIGVRPFATQFPDFGVIDEVRSNGNSNYNSLQTALKVRGWHRFSSQLTYTWAHDLDDMTQFRGVIPQNSFNLKGDYGNSDYDTRHKFTGFLTYDLPNASRGKRLLDGWQLSSMMTFYTGMPFSVFASSDNTGTEEEEVRANQIGDPFAGVNHSIVHDPVTGTIYEQWINAAAFTDPPPGTFGTSGRNAYHAPGYADVDFSVVKNTPITERVKAQFRIEMFNLFNRPNLAPPSNYRGGGFGQSADTIGDWYGAPGIGPGEPFNTQLAIKFIF